MRRGRLRLDPFRQRSSTTRRSRRRSAARSRGSAPIRSAPPCRARTARSVVLDMATSKIAMGKARVAANRGVPAPVGSLLDADGLPTQNAAVMFQDPQGALVSMGDHKGSGLAILCELLAGALTGGWTILPEHEMRGGSVNNMLSVVIDPEALGGRDQLWREGSALLAYIKAARPAHRGRRDPGAGRARAAPPAPAPGRGRRRRRAQLGRHPGGDAGRGRPGDPDRGAARLGAGRATEDQAIEDRGMERVDCVVIGAGVVGLAVRAPAGAGRSRGDRARSRGHDRHRDQLAQQRGDPRRHLLSRRLAQGAQLRCRQAEALPLPAPSTACPTGAAAS